MSTRCENGWFAGSSVVATRSPSSMRCGRTPASAWEAMAVMARRYSPPLIRRMRSHAAMRYENGLAEGRAMGDSQTASHVERWSTWDYAVAAAYTALLIRSEEHTSDIQSLMRI